MALNKIINDFVESADYDFSENGYIKLEGGLIVQWGLITVPGGLIPTTFDFPIPFNVSCFQVIVCDGSADAVGQYAMGAEPVSNAQFKVSSAEPGGGAVELARFIAIGV